MPDEIAAQNAAFPALGPRGRPKKPCEGASSARFSGKYGCRDYWGARLTRDFPEIAARVHAGVLSVNAAVISQEDPAQEEALHQARRCCRYDRLKLKNKNSERIRAGILPAQ